MKKGTLDSHVRMMSIHVCTVDMKLGLGRQLGLLNIKTGKGEKASLARSRGEKFACKHI